MSQTIQQFRVNTTNLQEGDLLEKEIPVLKDQEVLLAIEKFAFTANNITYAVIGEKFGYWKFFPTENPWGIIPVWGFAHVVESKNPDVKVGERFYGYFPMASHIVMHAGKVKNIGFTDISEHRSQLPGAYNFYFNVKTDRMHQEDTEELEMLFRPLFITSFLIDDFMADNQFFGSKHVVLTSASSKTALGLAFLIYIRKKAENLDINIVALTSAKNVEFVKKLGIYDTIYTYDQVDKLPLEPTSIVDFAGNHDVLIQMQNHLKEHQKYNCLVGIVQWDKTKGTTGEKVNGTLFFAPTYVQKRTQDWGHDGFQERQSIAWLQFIDHVKSWFKSEKPIEVGQIKETYLQTLNGNIDPQGGTIISMMK